MVIKGFLRKAGTDFGQLYAPVKKYTTLRLVLELVTQSQRKILQVDVKCAFLNGNIQEQLYIAQLEESETTGKVRMVMRLYKD